jgi:glycosyltransferase involved in cell wall biosynthesis
MGLKNAARRHLQQAFILEPRFQIYRALESLSFDPEVSEIPSSKCCLALDISDLLHFFISHGLVTGIQRVQLELLAAILKNDRLDGSKFDQIVFCFSELGWAWRPSDDDLRALIAYAEADRVDVRRARHLVRRAKARAKSITLPPGSSYLVLGAFWGGAEIGPYRDRIRSNGAAFGVLVHDLFPITMPQLCEEGATASFESKFRAGIGAWDFIVANSTFTANDIRGYLAQNGVKPAIPVIAAPLAHSSAKSQLGVTARAALSKTLRGRRFVLCVGTIEPRKNHVALLEAWKALDQVHPDLPVLVLVGRQGWRMGELVKELKRGALRHLKVQWLENISDAQLDTLYKEGMFTVFPSFAEGWGLPIGESLVHGKVCLASNTTAMPEVGGDFAIYIDPYDHKMLERTLERLLYDGETLAKQEEKIAQGFRPRTWSDVADDLINGLSALQRP